MKEPLFYISEDLQEAYHLNLNQVNDIILSEREVLDPFPKMNIYDDILKKWIQIYPEKCPEYKKKKFSKQVEKKNVNFFKKNKYLDGFKERLKELEYDEEELYNKLEEFANIFDIPTLPDKL